MSTCLFYQKQVVAVGELYPFYLHIGVGFIKWECLNSYLAYFQACAPVPHAIERVPELLSPLWVAWQLGSAGVKTGLRLTGHLLVKGGYHRFLQKNETPSLPSPGFWRLETKIRLLQMQPRTREKNDRRGSSFSPPQKRHRLRKLKLLYNSSDLQLDTRVSQCDWEIDCKCFVKKNVISQWHKMITLSGQRKLAPD